MEFFRANRAANRIGSPAVSGSANAAINLICSPAISDNAFSVATIASVSSAPVKDPASTAVNAVNDSTVAGPEAWAAQADGAECCAN